MSIGTNLSQELNKEREDQKKSQKRGMAQPLSVFTRTSIVVLLIYAVVMTALGLAVRQPDILVAAGIELLMAALMATGWRWTPLIGSIFGALVLSVLLFGSSYPIHHLTHPKDAFGFGVLTTFSFLVFCIMLVLFWVPVVLFFSGIAAVIQNYFQRVRRTPRWYKTVLTGAICILCGAFLLGVMQQPEVGVAAAPPGTVYLTAVGFSQSSIVLSKGEKLTLTDSGAYHHRISDGTWVNGQPAFNQQAGQPYLRNWDVNTSGSSKIIGPFTLAGTYHLFCSIHTGMTLTIIVQ